MRDKILRTLAYFDIFDYPLTCFELWKFLMTEENYSLGEVLGEVERLTFSGEIKIKNGFCFISGRDNIVQIRTERFIIAERKYKKALRAVKFLRMIPGIKMVAVCNTLAWSHSKNDSDIDLFIVSSPGCLWTTRILSILPFAMFGMRTSPIGNKDLFCFSFFVSEDALDFSPISIKSEDLYLVYWLMSLVPLYDKDGILDAIWDLNNIFSEKMANATPVRLSYRRRVKSKDKNNDKLKIKKGFFESFARAIQLFLLPVDIRRQMNTGSNVVVTDDILKFHSNDRREEFRELFLERCKSLGV